MPLNIAFQGERGAYSEQAAFSYFNEKIVTQPFREFADVFTQVVKGRVDFGVVPIENSLAGSIHQNYDLLVKQNVWISGEIIIRINHSLLAYGKTKLSDLDTIYSHPQALLQCQNNLRKLRIAHTIPFFDTAGSAKYIAEKRSTHIGAIASRQAAKEYGLKTLVKSLEDHEKNFTRFFVIRKRVTKPAVKSANKSSIVFALKNIPGALYKALSVFSMRDIDLLKIESRPIPGSPWKYLFYLDFSATADQGAGKLAMNQLQEITKFQKVLGSYLSA